MEYINGNPEKDFFDQNPELKFKKEFDDLLKSLGDKKASRLMWSIYMMYDPKSKFHRIPSNLRLEEIQSVYNPDFNPESVKAVITAYQELVLDKESRLYSIHMDKMEELTKHLESLDLEEDKDFDRYMKIIEKLPKAWDGLEKVRAKMFESQDKAAVHGQRKLSSRERRSR